MLRFVATFIALIAFSLSGPPAVAQSSEAPPAPAAAAPAPAGTDDALAALLKVLKNDTARQQLITRLEELTAPAANSATSDTTSGTTVETTDTAAPATPEAVTADTATTDQTAAAPADESTWSRHVADATAAMAEQLYAGLGNFWGDLTGIVFVLDAMTPEKRTRVSDGALALSGTIVVTFALHWLLSRGAFRLSRRPAAAEDDGKLRWPLLRTLRNAFVDALIVIVAYLLGELFSIVVGGTGSLLVEQSLFLNAFLTAGLFGVVIGIFLHPGRSQFSIFPLADVIRADLSRRLAILVSILVYGIVAMVPIANYWANFAAGRALRIVITSVTAVWALAMIRHFMKLEDADEEKVAATDDGETEPPNLALVLLRTLWPIVATLYVLASWGIALAQPALIGDLIGMATLQTVIVVGIAALLVRALNGLARNGVPVPRRLQLALPPLKERVQYFVPATARTLSALVLIAAGFLVLGAWNIINGSEILTRPEIGDFFARFGVAIVVIIVALFIWAFVSSFIDYRLSLNLPGRNVTARTRTLLALFKNAFTVVILTFAAMTALSQLGIDIAPLLAGAGVAGIAVGFGAQKMVQDVITGIFIQVENAINVGDVVTVAGVTGVVERLTIRSVGLRDLEGVYHIVPFSAVDTVSNFMRRFAYHVSEIGVAYKEDIPAVKNAMQEAFDRLKKTEYGPSIIDDFDMHGLIALADSSMVMRGRIKTKPGQQWAVGRAYTELVKQVFDERNIEIPYPHRTMVYQADVPPPYDGVPERPPKRRRARPTKASAKSSP